MNNEKIGKFLKKLREEKQITQETLANQLYIDRSVISKWERGKISIPKSYLVNLSEVFSISIEELILGKRKSKTNKKEFEQMGIILYDEIIGKQNDNSRLKRNLVTLIIGFSISIVFLLSYFFLTTYNQVRIYDILPEQESPVFNNKGIFLYARDKVFFRISPAFYQERKIKYFNLYYVKKNTKKFVMGNGYVNVFSFEEMKGYGEYLDFKDLSYFLESAYFEVLYEDGSSQMIPLHFELNYANNNFLQEKLEHI